MTTVKVTVDGSPTEYQYNNFPLIIKIKGGSNYTVEFGALANYAAPQPVSGTGEAGTTVTVEKEYTAHKLIFNFTPSEATASFSYLTDWDDVNSSTTITVADGDTILIPFRPSESAKYLTIHPNELEGYTKPNSKLIQITYPEQEINLEWGSFSGIYIMDLNGNLCDVSSWSGSSNATGVALINDNVSLVIAPDEWYTYDGDNPWNGNKSSAWGGHSKTVSGIKTTTSESDALTDFSGLSNTDAIISQLSGTLDVQYQEYTGAPAAEYCRAYSRGCKSAGQWYLPSAGEMNQIVANQDAIQEALNEISGEAYISGERSMTSTQYNSMNIWVYNWYNNSFNYIYKYSSECVRPVCQINNESSNTLRIFTSNTAVEWFELTIPDTIINGVSTWDDAIRSGTVLAVYFTKDAIEKVQIRSDNVTINVTHISGTTRSWNGDGGNASSYYIMDYGYGVGQPTQPTTSTPIYFDHAYYLSKEK